MKLEVMLWIVVLILLAVSLLFPKARVFSLAAIGVLIVGIVAIVVVAKHAEPPRSAVAAALPVEQKSIDFERFLIDKLDKSDPDAKNRIPINKIRFDQIRAEAGAERGNIRAVVARLYNESADYTLTDYGYYLAVQDCIRAVCTTVFDEHGLAAVSVPPDQARDVKIEIRDNSAHKAPQIKILGTANILLTAETTRAAEPSSQSSD